MIIAAFSHEGFWKEYKIMLSVMRSGREHMRSKDNPKNSKLQMDKFISIEHSSDLFLTIF